MALCPSCGKSIMRFSMVDGKCGKCYDDAYFAQQKQQAEAAAQTKAEVAADTVAVQKIILTTETAHNLPVTDRLGIVTAEVVIGMHVFKDIASVFRDVFGGRSQTMQKGLKEARVAALDELRAEALALGADAVVGVDLDYSEISGGGKSMLFLVASGTAVSLQQVMV